MRRHIIIKTVRSSTGGQLEFSFRSKLQGLQNYFFENFDNSRIEFPKILIPFIWRKPVSCRRVTLPAEREKKERWPQPAFAHALIVLPWLWESFTDTDRIWSGQSDRAVPFNLTKLFSPEPLICILLTSTITKLAVALVWSVQLECTVPLGTWIFPKARKVFMEKSWPG